MTQKNYKIKIKKNKVLVVEATTGAITNAMFDAGKDVTKAGADALKMTGLFLKRSWNSTFGYAWEIRKQIKKHGFPEGLEYANRTFIQKDKQVKREMTQLIKSQPGFKDANMFLSMTCPAAKAYDMFVDKVEIRDKGFGGIDNDDYSQKEANESKKAYYNALMAISHISHGTSIEKLKQNNVRLTNKQVRKKVKKKYEIEKDVENNIKDEKFINVCRTIIAYQSKEENITKYIKDNDLYFLNISLEQKEFLDKVLENNKEKEVINWLVKNEYYSTISRLADILIEKKSVESIKKLYSFVAKNNLKTKDKDEEQASKKSGNEDNNQSDSEEDADKLTQDLNNKTMGDNFNIKIKSGNKILVEEESGESETSEESGESETSEESSKDKPDAKEGMELSFSTYYVLRSLILSYISKINSQVPLIVNIQTEGTLSCLINDSKTEDFSNSIDDKVKSVNEDIEKVNKQIKVFNEVFETKLGNIDNKFLEEISEAKNKTVEGIKDSYQEIDEIKDEKQKEILKSKELLSVLEELTSASGEESILYDKFKKHVTDANAIIEEDLNKNIPQFLDTCKKYQSLLNKYSINANTIEKTKKNNEIANQSIEEVKNLESKISEYTNKKSEIQSLIDEYEKELVEKEKENANSETESMEIDKEKLLNKEEEK